MSNYYLCDLCIYRRKLVSCPSTSFPVAAMDRGYEVGIGHYYEYVDGDGNAHPSPNTACPYFKRRKEPK